MNPIFMDSLPIGVLGMGGYIFLTVVNFFLQWDMYGEVQRFWWIMGQKSDFSNMVSEALDCDNNGLEGGNYGIWVWLGEKTQVYDTNGY